ncbi:MAG: GDYXXLXY domain-containing protein [Betaproteobacteria bacterium]
MSRKLYAGVVLAALALLLAAVNFTIWQRETLLRDGQVVLLELAPVDPRSLMQGDYMALRFAVSRKLAPTDVGDAFVSEGDVVVKRDVNNVGAYERMFRAGEALAANESRVHYRIRKSDVRIVTNAYFFQEGTADEYSKARFGELRVAANGDALLTGMRDKDFKLLGPGKKS